MPKCPECHAPMKELQNLCDCGWQKTASYSRDPNHTRCSYEQNGERCIAGGSVSSNTRGGGPWYCAAHARTLDNPSMGWQIIQDYKKNGIPAIRRVDEIVKAYQERKK